MRFAIAFACLLALTSLGQAAGEDEITVQVAPRVRGAEVRFSVIVTGDAHVEIHVGRDPSFEPSPETLTSSITLTMAGGGEASGESTPVDLEPGTTYYVRVRVDGPPRTSDAIPVTPCDRQDAESGDPCDLGFRAPPMITDHAYGYVVSWVPEPNATEYVIFAAARLTGDLDVVGAVNGSVTSIFVRNVTGGLHVFQVRATLVDGSIVESEGTARLLVHPNDPPNVTFKTTPSARDPSAGFPSVQLNPGETIVIDASATDPEGGNVTFEIDWGDGTSDNTAVSAHSYESPGRYRVKVTARDERGLGTFDDVQVDVVEDLAPSTLEEPSQDRIPWGPLGVATAILIAATLKRPPRPRGAPAPSGAACTRG